jgi:hypothetical protein
MSNWPLPFSAAVLAGFGGPLPARWICIGFWLLLGETRRRESSDREETGELMADSGWAIAFGDGLMLIVTMVYMG